MFPRHYIVIKDEEDTVVDVFLYENYTRAKRYLRTWKRHEGRYHFKSGKHTETAYPMGMNLKIRLDCIDQRIRTFHVVTDEDLTDEDLMKISATTRHEFEVLRLASNYERSYLNNPRQRGEYFINRFLRLW